MRQPAVAHALACVPTVAHALACVPTVAHAYSMRSDCGACLQHAFRLWRMLTACVPTVAHAYSMRSDCGACFQHAFRLWRKLTACVPTVAHAYSMRSDCGACLQHAFRLWRMLSACGRLAIYRLCHSRLARPPETRFNRFCLATSESIPCSRPRRERSRPPVVPPSPISH